MVIFQLIVIRKWDNYFEFKSFNPLYIYFKDIRMIADGNITLLDILD